MCLAVPGLIESIEGNGMAIADVMGVRRQVSLDLLPHAKPGDYVLVHAGFGIEVVSEEDARETLALLEELAEVTGA